MTQQRAQTNSSEEANRFVEAHYGTPDGKLIATVQTCMRCGDTFIPTEGRKRCPRCQGHLKTKMTVIKTP